MKFSPEGFKNIFLRELRRIFFNRDLLLICFVAPLVYGIVLSSVYYHKRVEAVPVGIFDQDNTKISRMLVRWVDATQNVKVEKRYSNVDAAMQGMVTGEISGLLYIPRDFSNELKRGHQARVLAGVNSSNIVVANPVMQSFMEVAGTLSAGTFIKYLRKTGNVSEKASSLNQAIVVQAQPVYNPRLNYSDFFVPGLLFVIIQQITIVGLAFSVAEERQNHRGKKLVHAACGSYLSLLFGKILPYVFVNFALSVVFLVFIAPFYDLGFQGGTDWISGLTLVFVFVLSATSFGVFISSFFKNVLTAIIVLMFYSMPAFLVSGYAWPSFVLPDALRVVSLLFPSTFFLKEFRLLMLGHVPFKYVMGSAGVLLLFSLFCLVGTYLLFRRLLEKETT